MDDATRDYHLWEFERATNPETPDRNLPAIPASCASVLDIGGGAGQTLVASRLPASVLAVNVEVDVEVLALGKTLSEAVTPVVARGEHLPFRDGSFDMVISRVAMPYMNIPEVLAETHRVLAEGGRLWAVFHSPKAIVLELKDRVRQRSLRGVIHVGYLTLNGLALNGIGKCFHFPFKPKRYESFQTQGGIRRLLKRSGFTGVTIEPGQIFLVTATRGENIHNGGAHAVR